MASTHQSFDASPHGGYVESPHGWRGDLAMMECFAAGPYGDSIYCISNLGTNFIPKTAAPSSGYANKYWSIVCDPHWNLYSAIGSNDINFQGPQTAMKIPAIAGGLVSTSQVIWQGRGIARDSNGFLYVVGTDYLNGNLQKHIAKLNPSDLSTVWSKNLWDWGINPWWAVYQHGIEVYDGRLYVHAAGGDTGNRRFVCVELDGSLVWISPFLSYVNSFSCFVATSTGLIVEQSYGSTALQRLSLTDGTVAGTWTLSHTEGIKKLIRDPSGGTWAVYTTSVRKFSSSSFTQTISFPGEQVADAVFRGDGMLFVAFGGLTPPRAVAKIDPSTGTAIWSYVNPNGASLVAVP